MSEREWARLGVKVDEIMVRALIEARYTRTQAIGVIADEATDAVLALFNDAWVEARQNGFELGLTAGVSTAKAATAPPEDPHRPHLFRQPVILQVGPEGFATEDQP